MCEYNFNEFIAALEGDDFDTISPENLRWAKNFINSYDKKWDVFRHDGDCIGQSQPCAICAIVNYLNEYKKYCLNEKEWRIENKF